MAGMNKWGPGRLLAVFGLITTLLGAGPKLATAASVAVVPADSTVSIADEFYIRVEADAFADLKGYQLIFEFDPTIVQLVSALPGDVLTGPGAYFGTLVPDVSAPADSAWYDAAKLDGSTSGPGVLVYFRFKALQMGVSPLACRYVDYRDSNNAQTLPGCSGGVIRVVGPTTAMAASWGRMKVLYR